MNIIERLIVAKDSFARERPMLRDTINDAANEIERLRAEIEKAFCKANPLVSKCQTCGELIVYPTQSE